MRISEFIEKSNLAVTTEELFDLFAMAVKPFGPDLLAFGALTPAAQKKFISEDRPAPAVALKLPRRLGQILLRKAILQWHGFCRFADANT